jgi:hypothetical protein
MAVIDIAGQRYGKLVVIRQVDGRLRGSSLWECRCDCGGTTIKSSNMLRTGHAKSCGCLNLGEAQKAAHTKHGMVESPEYAAWKDMKRRCLNPNAPNYKDYGGRGITICSRWLQSFQNFFDDMGKRPEGKSLERKNNNGNYAPGNCKWANRFEQARNTRRNRYVELDGRRQTVSEWAREIGRPPVWLRDRLDSGMSPRKAIFGGSK